MKKSDFIYKTIQLVLYLVLTACCLGLILLDQNVYHLIASDFAYRTLCIFLWLALGLSFLFIYRDFTYFSSYSRRYRELNHAVHSDPLSGLANRFGCDVMIERYLDKPIPENLGCIMFDLTNLHEVNTHYGHLQGNRLIRDFSNILHLASDPSSHLRIEYHYGIAFHEDSNICSITDLIALSNRRIPQREDL